MRNTDKIGNGLKFWQNVLPYTIAQPLNCFITYLKCGEVEPGPLNSLAYLAD